MSRKHLVGAPVTLRFKPAMEVQLLRGCAACAHPHPRAMKPMPADLDHCPGCSAVVADADPAIDVPELGGSLVWAAWLANAHHWLAEQLLRLAKRI